MPEAPTQYATREDITRRKQAQDAWQENELLFRLLFEKSGDANLLLDGDVFTDCNQAALKMLGCPSKEELLPFHPRDLSPQRQPDGRLSCEKEKELIAIALQEGTLRFEWVHRRLDGTDFPVEVLLTAIPLHGKKVLHTVWRDITSYKQAEQETRRRTTQLQALQKTGLELGLELAAELDLDLPLRSMAARAVELLNGTSGGLFLYRPDLDVLEGFIFVGANVLQIGSILRRGEGLAGKVWETGQPLWVNDYQHWEGRAAIFDGLPIAAAMCAPIRWGQEFLGVLNVTSDDPHTFSSADAELLSLFATQAAVAIQHARLFQSERLARQRLETLYRIGQIINSRLDFGAILDQLTEEAMHVTHAAYGSTFVVRPDLRRFEQRSLRGYPAELTEASAPILLPLDSGLNGQAYHTRQIVCVDDVPSAPEYLPNLTNVRSELVVPLIRGDQVLGNLDLQSPEVGAFRNVDLDFLRALTDQVAIALENARLFEDAQRRARELSMLMWAGEAVAFPLDLEVVLRLVIDEVKRMMGTEAVSVLLCEPALAGGGEEFVFAAVVGPISEKLVGKRMPVTAGIAGWVVREKRGVMVTEAQQDAHFYTGIDDVTGMNTHSLLAVPLLTKGAVTGVIETLNKTKGVFTPHDLEMLEAIAGTAAVAIENARLFKAEREQYRRLQESQTQLIQAEKMAALGRLAATLAHEINNPLQAITSDLELILDFPLGPEERDKRLRVARQEIDRLSEMTRRVLTFARPSLAPRESVSVADLIKQTLALAGKKLQHSHIQVTTDFAIVPPIMAAPNQLVQVFLNLVINAIEAIYDHGQIHISLGVEGEQVVARFANDGPPIAPEDLSRIFEPFFTTKEDGTGLGLSVCHRIITQHDGTLTVENLPHKQGVVFTVRLPLIRGDDRPGSKT